MSKRTLCILTLTVLLLASSIPFIFPERSQVFFAKACGRETLIYPAKIDLGSVEPGSEHIARFRAYNLTSYAIAITTSSTSCGCLTLNDVPDELPSGDSFELTLAIHVPKYQDQLDQYATLFLNESGGLAIRNVHVLATIPNPLPLPKKKEGGSANQSSTSDVDSANAPSANVANESAGREQADE